MHDKMIKEEGLHCFQQSGTAESIRMLVGEVLHDLNNILTVIIGACTLLEGSLADNPEQMPFVSRIQTYAERAARLSRDLLLFEGERLCFPRPENIAGVLREMFRFLDKVIGKHINFITELSENTVMVMIDRGQIEQVIMSLAAHSRDAMPMGGDLSITLSRIRNDGSQPELAGYGMGGYALITVSYAGVGIDDDGLRRMPELGSTAGQAPEAAGPGPLIAHGVIIHHGGFMHVRSKGGQGAAFDIYLPLWERGKCMGPDSDGVET